MDWLKKNYDKAALGALALILLACSGFLIMSAMSFPEVFSGRNTAKPQNNNIPPLPIDQLRAAVKLATSPSTWTAGHQGSLFVSSPYVLKEENGEKFLFSPLKAGGDQQMYPPIKNSWLVQYEIDYSEDPRDLDPDEDRFSNLEEYNEGTDPKNARSLPGYQTKLRLVKFIPKPFRLVFKGSPDEGKTFAINTKDLNGRTQFLTIGDMIKGAPYKILSYEQKSGKKNDIDVDLSELVIENTDTHKKIVLVNGQEANDPTSIGEFRYRYDNSDMKLTKDEEFILKPETDRKYKLIDISEENAQIQDLKSGDKFTIPRDNK